VNTVAGEGRIDALLPPEMAKRAEYLGVRKAEMPFVPMFSLAVLAGAFIALGAMFATTVSAGAAGMLPFGLNRLLVGLVFCLGLILVIVGGAELFTGNNLIVMAWASRKVTTAALLRNWAIVYAGNLVGSLFTAFLVLLSRQHLLGGGEVGKAMLTIALGKVGLDFVQAVALGILCNTLVCLAVWLSYSARGTGDKIMAILFPITAFVAAGFEHSVANMYFLPVALGLKIVDPAFVAASGIDPDRLDGLTWPAFLLGNLLPVTIGNIIGGAILVAAVYWFIFLRRLEG
jgi:formate/nitrite transporter